ncbi:MAG: DUF6677 family protein [Acidobacteriota bacterium]
MTSSTSARESPRGTDLGLNVYAVALVAWLVPGAAHFWLGQTRKAIIFFVMLSGMFAVGLAFGGRLFPFQISDPLVFLAAAAEWGQAVPRVVAAIAGAGAGDVVAASYEYGNTFLMVSGLLNMLVVLNAVDVAAGRRTR